MTDYTLAWDGRTLTLPAAITRGTDRDAFISDYDQLDDLYETHRRGSGTVRIPVRLIPRPDNDYNQLAVSIAAPPRLGASIEDRHLGFLYDAYLDQLGMQTLHDLSRYSTDGEIRCEIRCDAQGLRSLALPAPRILRAAIIAFLTAPTTPPLETRPPISELTGLETYGTELSREVRTHLTTWLHPQHDVGALALSAQREGEGMPRTVRVDDVTHARTLGEIAHGWLFLRDERDREAVLAHLDEQGVPVAHPVPAHRLARSGHWPEKQIPNTYTHRRHSHLDFRPVREHKPSYAPTYAAYNATTRTLFVEADEFTAPACVYAARLGLIVKQVKVPRRPWRTDGEFGWSSRQGAPLSGVPLDDDPFAEGTWGRPALYRRLRKHQAAELLIDDDVLFTAKPPPASEFNGLVEDHLDVLEPLVAARVTAFPDHEPVGTYTPCRLCGTVATAFAVPGCTDELAYCHGCLEYAQTGVARTRAQALAALTYLTRHEFDGLAPMEQQLARVHLDSEKPVRGSDVDARMLARFALRRGTWSWTRLLSDSGLFPKGGMRMARGTLLLGTDGHLCLSMQEKVVDDFFHHHAIAHEREPHYPYDAVLNPRTRRRADWLLGNGTLVELWGMPDVPAYAARMAEKQQLAEKYGIRLVGLVKDDLLRLPSIFADWTAGTPEGTSTWTPPQPSRRTRAARIASDLDQRAPGAGAGGRGGGDGRNEANAAARVERLARCARALALQRDGMTRAEIAALLEVGAETVKDLLRDARFYANPASDPDRAAAAAAAADARKRQQTRTQFYVESGLSKAKALTAWKDADSLHPPEPGPLT